MHQLPRYVVDSGDMVCVDSMPKTQGKRKESSTQENNVASEGDDRRGPSCNGAGGEQGINPDYTAPETL
jgi:hypothetical protein